MNEISTDGFANNFSMFSVNFLNLCFIFMELNLFPMKKIAQLFLAGTIILLLCIPFLLKARNPSPYAGNRIIVRFNEEIGVRITQTPKHVVTFGLREIDLLNERYNCVKVRNIGSNRNHGMHKTIYLLEFQGQFDIPVLIREYLETGYLKYAEPDYKGGISGFPQMDSVMPNDTYFNRQWSLYNNGTFSSPIPAVVDADIDMNQAWAVEQGDTSVVVGIIDTGLKLDHPEFSGRIWNNKDEIPGNGIDDDGNQYIDDIKGWDFANSDNDPADDEGHGTNVTGIIGANGNNSIGYAGVDWNCKLMVLKGINSENWGYYSWWVEAIHYAVDNGAKAINMSVCGTSASSALSDGVVYAIQNNVAIIACMGNANNNVPNYPAAYLGVIAVGSTDPDDTRSNPFFWSTSSGSNFNTYISVVAPGNYIYGLHYQNNNNYDTYWGGTSQATPHVTGLVSLLLAQDSTRTPEKLKNIIEATAQDQVGDVTEDTPGWDQYYGWGRINAYSALIYHPSVLPSFERSDIRIFPNPSSGMFFVETNYKFTGNSEIIVSDVYGQIVKKEEFTLSGKIVDMRDVAKGVYFLSIRDKNFINTSQLIVK